MSTGSARQYLARFGHDEHEPMPRHLTPEAYLEYREGDMGWRQGIAWDILEQQRRYRDGLPPFERSPDRHTFEPADTGLVRKWMTDYGAGDSTDAEALTLMGAARDAVLRCHGEWGFCEWAASEAWGDVTAWWLEYGDRADYHFWLREQGGE